MNIFYEDLSLLILYRYLIQAFLSFCRINTLFTTSLLPNLPIIIGYFLVGIPEMGFKEVLEGRRVGTCSVQAERVL